jgi:hypothetical protein
MNALNHWLEKRSGFADWIGDQETFERKKVELERLPHSSALGAHPGLFATLRWCVGLQRLGGILFNHQPSSVSTFVDAAAPEAFFAFPQDPSTPPYVVGFHRPGGILYPEQPSNFSIFFDPGAPISVDGQWRLHGDVLSDWVAEQETAEGQYVSLSDQLEGFVAHPLVFGMLRSVVGFQRLGGISYPQVVSGFASGSPGFDLLLDAISDEEFRILVDEDTGEPLGIG